MMYPNADEWFYWGMFLICVLFLIGSFYQWKKLEKEQEKLDEILNQEIEERKFF